MWIGDQGSLAKTKWSAPAPPVSVSEPMLAVIVSDPAPPTSDEPTAVAVSTLPAVEELSPVDGEGLVGVLGVEPVLVLEPVSWAQVRPFEDTCSRSTT